MKLAILLAFVLAVSSTALGQRNVVQAVDRDPAAEAEARHNLEVAKNYFLLKKAYKAVLERFEETFAAYPDFSRMDEFLYYAGMSSWYLSNNEGKQKVDMKIPEQAKKYEPAKLRVEAAAYLTQIGEKYPDSKFLNESKKALAKINATAAQ
jgi:outer membrane protein assembly factor BamD (BamD/ComL family)